MTDWSNLVRDRQPMPDFVAAALAEGGMLPDFQRRPAYQQNDYLAWIGRAKRASTKEKRLQQMLTELRTGGVYMKMPHPASAKRAG